jgi:hypothetical protein
MLDPRVILQALLDRLEPEVGTISRAQLRRESASGAMPAWLGHLATSALLAREALMSGDQKQMAGAAALCPQHERIGRRLQQRHTATIMRHAGGKRRGNHQTRDAGVVWEPYLQMAQKLIESNADRKTARRSVVKQMEQDNFTLPNTGQFPSEKTIDHWLGKIFRNPA